MNASGIPKTEAYRTAFLALQPQMTTTRRKLLRAHYHFLYHQATMTQIAEAMGWKSYSSANSHYGSLAKLVAQKIGFNSGDCHLGTLCTFIEPEEQGDHWLIIMRQQVVEALEQIGWT